MMRGSFLVAGLILVVGCEPRTSVETPPAPSSAPTSSSPTASPTAALTPSAGATATPPPILSPSATTPSLTALTISAPSRLHAGGSAPLRASATDSSGNTHDVSLDVAWSVSDESVLHVGQGVVVGVADGTAELRASLGALTRSVTITVAPAQLVSLAIQPGAAAAPLGASAQLQAVGTYDDGSTQDLTAQAAWATADATIAVPDATPGQIDTVAIGATRVTATVGTFRAGADLTVGPADLASLLVVAGVPRPYGTPQQLVAIGTYTDGSTADLTNAATWQSMNPAQAQLDPHTPGLIEAPTSCAVMVQANIGAVQGTTQVVFTPKLLGLVTDNDGTPLPVGSCRTIHTSSAYDDGSFQSADDAAQWTPSDATVATVSSDWGSVGQVCALASGTVTLSVHAGLYATTTTVVVP